MTIKEAPQLEVTDMPHPSNKKWYLAILYKPKPGAGLSIGFRPFATKCAAKRAFKKEYRDNPEILSVDLQAPLSKNIPAEKLK